MPRPAKGPRLYLNRYKDGRPPLYIIRDGDHRESTGCGGDDRDGASRALEAYLRKKHRPSGSSNPAEVPVADALRVYAEYKMGRVKRPDMVLHDVGILLQWWGTKMLSEIKGATCDGYERWRVGQPIHHAKKSDRKVGRETARRELETLRAAVNHYHRQFTLDVVPAVTIPPKSPGRERWLSRSELARLLWAAWREPKAKHLARFILLGIYTGTRHDAILRLGWAPTPGGGWVDVDRGVLYRRANGEQETKKRRPPIRIPRRLLAHLRRWHRADAKRQIGIVVHYDPVGEKRRARDPRAPGPRAIRKERRAWRTACDTAKLGPEVVPHVLRHTAATWLMQAGVDKWETAGFLGMTFQQLERTYGHHHPDHQSQVSEAF